ncbi:MAG: sigma-70 family RNA polymerase sigma factor, partial [Anaerolineae bacterium]|nr:sigma-70 family RNA polymerase sigma factor [Anaerolineae bacterium]
MTTISTQELIRRYQAGQTDLFDAIFDRYKDYVYRVAYSYAQNAAEAEDATQEAFLDVLKALPRYDLDGPARFETWLYRVTANRAKMRLRRRRPNLVEWDEVEFTIHDHNAPQPEQSAQQADTQRAL